MKFIIYGAGYRGKRLLRYLGGDRVSAFIDSDIKKQGDVIDGKIVISFEEYKVRYASDFVIISPSNSTLIKQMFNECNIYSYSVLSDLPSEFSGYGRGNFNGCYKHLLKKYARPCYLFGINAFSVLLFYELQLLGNEVYFIQDGDVMEPWLKKHMPNCFCDATIKQANVFLCCYTYVDDLASRYSKCNLIDAYDYTSNLSIYCNKKIERLKNVFFDRKRCFIVATGPSLQEYDLQILKQNGEFCFGVNKIFKMNSTWKPNVYVVTDSFLIKDEKEKIREYDADIKFIGDGNIVGYYNNDNIYIVHVVGSGYGTLPPPFSEDVEQKVYGGGTVVYACIQVAVYMGFREIYLLGVDCNYEVGSKENHFYKDSPDMIEHDLYQMTLAFQAAQSYAKMHEIKIFNATRGGALEVFDRVDFDALFEK